MFTPSTNSNRTTTTTTKTKTPMFLSPAPTLLSPTQTPPNSSSCNPRTPPPSLPSSPSFHTPTFAAKAFLPEATTSAPQNEKQKHRLRLWHTLLIPLVLFAIGLSTRWIRHPVVLDSLVGLTRPDPESNSFFHKRHPDGVSVSINLPTPTSSSSSSSSHPPSSSSSSTSTSIPTIPTTTPILPTPFPQPWDQSGVPLNFSTQGCHNFFLNMTNSESFRSCRSFGMLQAWSDNFIDAQTNLTLLNTVLWGTCNPPLGADACTDGLRQWAEDMVNEDNSGACQQEWNERNQVVVTSRAALLSYPLLLSTSCLALSNTNTYCYVSSIAQGPSAASDIYLYSLPLGISFPKTARPSCGACEKDLLGAFGGYLDSSSLSPSASSSSSSNSDPKSNPTLDLSDSSQTVGLKSTYNDAVSVIEQTCGTGFVASGAALGSHSSGSGRTKDRIGMGMGMVLVVAVWGLGL